MQGKGDDMENILVVSSSSRGCEVLTEILKTENPSSINAVGSGSEARRNLLDNEYELVVIVTPLSDEFGHELANSIAEVSTAGVILIIKRELADDIASEVEDYGVFVVEKPVNRQVFYQALKMVNISHKRYLRLKKENMKLQDKIKEIRLVDRAKCVLIQYLSMSEKEAHRYIEKEAMDRQVTRQVIAENILKTYES